MEIKSKIKIGKRVLILALFITSMICLFYGVINYINTKRAIESKAEFLLKAITISNTTSFLEENYTSLALSFENLENFSDELGLSYVALYNSDGHLILKKIFTQYKNQLVNDKLFENIDAHLESLKYSKKTVNIEAKKFYQVFVPIEIDEDIYGGFKFGFEFKKFYADAYKQIFYSILISLFFILFAVTFAFIVIRSQEDYIFSTVKQTLDLYKKEISAQLEKDITKKMLQKQNSMQGPLSPKEFFSLLDYAKKINSSLNTDEILKMFVGAIIRILQVKYTTVFLKDEDNNRLRAEISYGPGGIVDKSELDISIKIGEGEVGLAAELGQTNIINTPKQGAGVAAAITARGKIIGVFSATENIHNLSAGEKEKLLARLIAQITGNALYNALLFEEKNK